MKKAREQEAAVEAIGKLGGQVGYGPVLFCYPLCAAPPAPAWLRNLLGEHFFARVDKVSFYNWSVADAGLEQLKAAERNCQMLSLSRTPVTDADLMHLTGLANLRVLYLCDTPVTDAGLEHVKGLTKLKALWLGGTKVTDAGLEHLKGLTKLKALGLGDTLEMIEINEDSFFCHQTEKTHLRTLGGTKVTDAGVKKLQQALPNCKISR